MQGTKGTVIPGPSRQRKDRVMALMVWHCKQDLFDRPSDLEGVLCLVESGAPCLTMFLKTM